MIPVPPRNRVHGWYIRFYIWVCNRLPRIAELFGMNYVSYRVVFVTSCPLNTVRFRRVYKDDSKI